MHCLLLELWYFEKVRLCLDSRSDTYPMRRDVHEYRSA